jgi:hypothetical protein
MKSSPRKSTVKSSRKTNTPSRALPSKKSLPKELSPEEVTRLEHIANRHAQAEKAWQQMTAPIEGDEPWSQIEEQHFERPGQNQERRWKFFSK